MSLIDSQSVPQLAERFPHRPARLRHNLAEEPLLGYAALAEAARGLPSDALERRVADARNAAEFRLIADAAHPADAIAAGGADSEWIMLRGLETQRAYRNLFHDLLTEIASVIGPVTDPDCELKSFVFVSAPGTHTPLHFDAEYNILFQILGDKVFAAYPPAAPFLGLAQREAYHRAGDNMLEWRAEFAGAGEQHLLAPGDALFVPYAAPHWVRAGDTPSVSLSLTWQCRRSRAVADALSLNPLLRRFGLPAYDPEQQAGAPWLRAAAGRVGQRIGLL